MKLDITAQAINCPNCGAKLTIPKNSTGSVVCMYCGSSLFLNGLINEELLKKNAIIKGIPLKANIEQLTDAVTGFLTESGYYSPEIFQKTSITKIERIAVPGYIFDCNSSANYTYDVGNERVRQDVMVINNQTTVSNKKYIEWSSMNGVANVNKSIIVSGCKQYESIIRELYSAVAPMGIVEAENLNYPDDILSEDYDVSMFDSFNFFVKPEMQNCLRASAEMTINSQMTRNFSLGEGSVQKNSEIKISIGLYKIYIDIDGKKYSIYVDGYGTKYYSDFKAPVDEKRFSYEQAMLAKKKSSKDHSTIVFLSLAPIAITCLAFQTTEWIVILCTILGIVAIIMGIVLNFKHKKLIKSISDDIRANSLQGKEAKDAFVKGQYRYNGMGAEDDGREFDYKRFI